MNDFFTNESTYPNGVAATYREADLPEYCGNPLIEALPPLVLRDSREGLIEILSRGGSSNMRETLAYPHAVVNAADFFTPLPIYLALQQQVDRMLRSGYLNRNPLAPGYWPSTNLELLDNDEE